MKLDSDSIDTLERRSEIGVRCIEIAGGDDGETVDAEDRETFAKDAISDILTALWGPAGYCSPDGDQQWNEFALNEARRVIEEAMRSYEGDAEDYTRLPS